MKLTSIPQWREIESSDVFLKEDLKKNDNQLKVDFKEVIQFQPTGLHTKMGAGTNKLNIHTISLFAHAFLKLFKQNSILIAHDNRHNGKLYSQRIASILSKAGIKIFLFEKNEASPSNVISYVLQKEKLGGAIYIGSQEIGKRFNGIRVYNKQGFQYSFKEYLLLNKAIEKIETLEVKKLDESKLNISYVNNSIIDKYLSEVLDKTTINPFTNNLKVAFSPLRGVGGNVVKELFKKTDHELFITKKQFGLDPNFSKLKTNNLRSSKAYSKTYRLSAKVKADLGIITDAEARNIGVITRYKKRFKILKAAEISAIYLDYKLSKLKKTGQLKEESYIVKSLLSGDLISKIANKYNVKIVETKMSLVDLKDVIKEQTGNFVLAVDENQSFINDLTLSKDKDSIQTIVALLDVVNFYKSKNKSLFDRLIELHKIHGIHRTSNFEKKVSTKTYSNLVRSLRRTRYISNLKIDKTNSEYEEFNEKSPLKLTKVKFKNGSWFTLRYNPTKEKSLKVFVQTIGKRNEELMDIVIFEKQISDWINSNTEVFENKSWSWKAFVKYAIFILIIIGIMAFVFTIIYKDSSTVNSAGKSGELSPYSMATIIAKGTNRFIWLSFWLWQLASRVLASWKLRRMLQVQNQSAKIRHLLVGQIMGSVISFVTPFAIGGDAIGYWYMRRKGIERGALIATYASDTLLFQAKFTLETLILVGIGWPIYRNIFNHGDPQASAALIWFIIGVSWTLFATIMIFVLTLSKSFQEFCFRNALKLIEWTKMVVISDPGFLLAKYQYEFYGIRKGMRDLWFKWWFPFEMIFYSMLPLFVNPTTIALLNSGWIHGTINGVNGYMGVIVIDDIINTANSMSLTPGGSGTAEWLMQVTKQWVYNGDHTINGNIIHYSTPGITSAVDLISKLFFNWPLLLFSTCLIVSIVPLENYRIAKEKSKIIRYKFFASTIWVALIIGFIFYFFLIFR